MKAAATAAGDAVRHRRTRRHRVHFPSALGMEFEINSAGGRFEPELRDYVKCRQEELDELEADSKRVVRAWRRGGGGGEDAEVIWEQFRQGACCGGEVVELSPQVFEGSHTQVGGGVRLQGVGEGNCSRGEGEGVKLREADLLDRSFDLFAEDIHRTLTRSRGKARVIGVVFSIFCIILFICILMSFLILNQF